MDKITAILVSLITMFTQFFGLAGSADYKKQTNISEWVKLLTNKKDVISESYSGETSSEQWNEDSVFDISECATIYKDKNKNFTILNLSDIHFEDFGYRSVFSLDGETSIRRLVASVSPDLITLTGDIVCGESDIYSIKRITDLFESFGIPWAPVFGNHDDEANCDLDYLCDIMMKSPHCLMRKGDPAMGRGNYIVNIAEKDNDDNDTILSSLIFMDSHHNQPNELQQKWFRWAAEGINNATNGNSEISVFMHIPIPEFQYAIDEGWDNTSKCWKKEFNGYGSFHETVACERDTNGMPLQRGFFDVIKSTGTKFVFCGHDHMNNYSVEYKGVRLTYTMKLGYGSGFQFGFNGGTVIDISSNGIKNIKQYTLTFGPRITIENIKL